MITAARMLMVLGIVASCRTPVEPLGPAAQIIDLSTSLDEFRNDFNAHRGEARFLTLLAPS